MRWRVQDRLGRAILDDPARIHDGDPVTELGHDAEVMGNEDDGQPAVTPQIIEQRQDLRLHCHVQCCRRLISDDHVRVVCQGHGDADTLPHSAGHFVRVALDAAFRVGDAHGFQQGDGMGPGLGFRRGVM